MTPGWALTGFFLCVVALYRDPVAAFFAAAGAMILLLDHLNHTVGKILKLAVSAAKAFVYRQDDQIETMQALSRAVIRWRKI